MHWCSEPLCLTNETLEHLRGSSYASITDYVLLERVCAGRSCLQESRKHHRHLAVVKVLVRAHDHGASTRQAVHCSTLLHTSHCCSTLLNAAQHCSTQLNTAEHCSSLLYTAPPGMLNAAQHCFKLLQTAPNCSTLLHTAADCSTRAA